MGFDVWLENRTPFEAMTTVQLDADGQEVLVALISGSFVDPEWGGQLALAPGSLPVCLVDEPYGDPELSSIRYESDVAPVKPGVEVIVLGHAHAPGGKPARSVEVGFQAGRIRKALTVIGDRILTRDGMRPPDPFVTMPLVWERAFGGTRKSGKRDPRNPVGVGWRDARSADPNVRTHKPNIVYQGDTSDTPRPAGFAPVGRGWLPRLPLAGTYDQAWQDEQWPLLARDFDPRHYLCAPEDQRVDQLPPGTPVDIANMTPNGRWSFRLPGFRVPLRLVYEDRVETVETAADTVIIEPDLGRVSLKARHCVRLVRNGPRLIEIVLGHVSPVWLNARRKGKDYINLTGGDGTLPQEPVWVA